MVRRVLGLVLVGMVLGVLGGTTETAMSGEPRGALSREELVATVERAPGPSKGPEDAPVVLVEFSDPFEVFQQALDASLAAPRRGPTSRAK